MTHTESSQKIYFTNEYARFNMINGNRPLNEAKALEIILFELNPLAVLLLSENQRKSIDILRKGVDKKKVKYQKYFKK